MACRWSVERSSAGRSQPVLPTTRNGPGNPPGPWAVAPHMRRLFEALGGLGVPTIHFGTGATGLLEGMAAAGGDVIGLDWRIALGDGWARVPGRAVQGNLDPAVLLGPWDAVEQQARWVLAEAGGRPGHIFNLGHGVLPETDPDTLRRLVEFVYDVSDRGAGRPMPPRSAAR